MFPDHQQVVPDAGESVFARNVRVVIGAPPEGETLPNTPGKSTTTLSLLLINTNLRSPSVIQSDYCTMCEVYLSYNQTNVPLYEVYFSFIQTNVRLCEG